MPEPRPLILVSRRFAHHGRYSGYDRLAHHLPEARIVRPPVLRRFRGCDRLRGWIDRVVSPRYYGLEDVVAELRVAALSAGATPAPLWHFLYGEDQLGFFHRLRLPSQATVVASVHQPPDHVGKLMRDLRPWSHLHGIVTMGVNQLALARRHAPRALLRAIPHGVDTGFFTPADRPAPPACDRAATRPLEVLIVGQWLRDLPRAARIAAALPRDGFSFRYIGPAWAAGPFAGTPVRVDSGLDDEQLRAAYRAADLLWLPLLDATANNALLEALACGLPVAAPEVGGLAGYAAHGGVHLYPPDTDEAAELAALAARPARLAGLRAAARPAAERFAWPIIASALRAFYDEAAHEPAVLL